VISDLLRGLPVGASPREVVPDHSSDEATVQVDRPWRKRDLRRLAVNRGESHKNHLARVKRQVLARRK